MLTFSIDSGRVVIDPLSIQLNGLRQIYESDTSMLKETAIRVLTYIHLVSQLDPSAPFSTASFDEVRPLVKEELFQDAEFEFANEQFIEDCIDDYLKAYEETDARAKRIFRRKIDEILSKLDSHEVEVVRNNTRQGVTFTSNFPMFQKMMAELGPLMEQERKIEEQMRNRKARQNGNIKVRANSKLSRTEEKLRRLKQANAQLQQENQQEEENNNANF